MESRFRPKNNRSTNSNVVPPPYGPTQRAPLTDNTAHGGDNLSGKLNKVHFKPGLGCLIIAIPGAVALAIYINSMSP